jgi:rod shape determining protein RodA
MFDTLRRKLDWTLLLSLAGLLVLGWLALSSASASQSVDYAGRQLVWLLIGLPVLLICALTPPALWFALSWLLYFGSLLLLLAVKLAGAMGMGAERWIELGGLRFQPSELGKIALVLALARLLSDNRIDLSRPRTIFLALGVAALPMAFVLVQPDLGTALAYAFVTYPLLIRAGLPFSWMLFLVAPLLAAAASLNIFVLLLFILLLAALLYASEAGIGTMAGVLSLSAGIGFALPQLWNLLKPYQQQRILVFLDPEADPLGAGYQIIQSKVAIGSGGLWGKGYLEGSQTQLAFLPEHHTDFIFAVLAEEFGLLGAALLLLFYGALLLRALHVGLRHRSSFCGLAMTGFASLLFFHVLVNIGMTLGVMPVTGLPLPFLSYGGSFLWTCLAILGLLLNFSWHRRDSLT